MKKNAKKNFRLFGFLFGCLLSLPILSGCSGSTVTISFETNCDTVLANQEYKKGSSFKLPTNLSKWSYQLEGWYYDSDLTDKVEATNWVAPSLKVKGDTTISAAEMWIVEINEHNDVRLLGYNHNKKAFVVNRTLKDVTNTKNFTSFDELAEKEPIPEFPEGSEVKAVSNTMSSILIEFPKAVSEGYIESYRVRVTLNDKNETFFYHLGCQYFEKEPETHQIMLSNLNSKKDYKVEVYAVNAFDKVSTKPLVATLSTR